MKFPNHLTLRLKSLLINWTCGASNWISEHVRYDLSRYESEDCPIGWRDHLRWFLEGILSRVFGWAYKGSREEVRDGIEFATDGTSPRFLTANQREIRARLSEWVDTEEAV